MEYIYRGNTYGGIKVLPNMLNLYGESDVRADIKGYEDGSDQIRNMCKYPNREANVIVIRYEEVVLGYAEALFQLGETEAALTLFHMIPEARMAAVYDSVTEEYILLERRKELIFEGLYYWDLMRYEKDIEKVDVLQNIFETVAYGDFRLAYPLPLTEIDANSNIEENRGY